MKKLIVITGASSGFGKEMAYLFNKANHPLLLLGRRRELMEEYNLDNTIVEQVDVTNKKEFESAIRKAEAVYGKTDLLINNAGVMLLGNITTQNNNEWQTMLDTNVIGVLNGIQIVLSDMVARNSGTIINISSIAGFKPFANHAAYCASKYGVHALSETIRQEVSSSNVRLMIIAPGAAETELLSHTTNQQQIEDYNSWKNSTIGLSLNPKHVATAAKYMYDMPQEVNIRELSIAATKQDQ